MLDAQKPLNVYCNESGYTTPNSSGDSSRRNSFGFKEYVRNRRFTMLSRPNRMAVSMAAPENTALQHKIKHDPPQSSTDSQFCDVPDDIDDDISPRPVYQRRMSVPEKVFLSMDYAILRPSTEADVRFEIIAAFDRNTDPYRHYMQGLTCYDLQPNHGAVVVIDGALKIHKALTALSQCGHQAAVVANMDERGSMSILTMTDCLRAIVLASEGVQKVADMTVAQFLRTNGKKHLVHCDVNTTVWDAARTIILNRVHRVPILHIDEKNNGFGGPPQGELLYVLSLKTVFMETVLKLGDPKLSLSPHMKQRTLGDRKVGTWSELYTIKDSDLCRQAISIFLEKGVSCVPVLDEDGCIVGVVSKSDVMNELIRHPLNYLEILDLPIMDLLENCPPPRLGSPMLSILEAINLLVHTDKQSIMVADLEKRPLGIVSYSDLMDYIQNHVEFAPQHKHSVA